MEIRTQGSYWLHATTPIDSWTGWMTLEEACEAYRKDRYPSATSAVAYEATAEFRRKAEQVIAWASPNLKGLGWEGDGQWLCATLPDPDTFDCLLMFSVKQQNNGNCYFAAPQPLFAGLSDPTTVARFEIGDPATARR